MSKSNSQIESVLYAALDSPIGVVVTVHGVTAELARQKLYAVRKTSTLFLTLAFVISPFSENQIWIIKKGEPNAEET